MRLSILFAVFLLIGGNSFAAKEANKFQFFSTALKDGQALSAKYSCLENDINPSIELRNIPDKTRTFAITVVSPDAPEGTWVHWVVYNIDAATKMIKEGAVIGTPLFNDFGKFGYNGPCPNDNKEHHFVFTVYAMNSKVDVIEGGILKDFEKAMRGKVLAQSSITVSFRKPS